MANGTAVNSKAMTLEQAQSIIDNLKSQLEAAKETGTRKLKISHSQRGSGTVTLNGFGRNPMSFYPTWLETLKEGNYIERMITYATEHADELRACAYAMEQCKANDIAWANKGAAAEKFNTAYDAFYSKAIADKTLKASKWED